MTEAIKNHLRVLSEQGSRLHGEWNLEWSAAAQQAVNRLCMDAAGEPLPTLAAVVGGASSGKSTVFNNLLEGHIASRVTARGHATRGAILAVHEEHRPRVEKYLAEGLLLPGMKRTSLELDENTTGEADAVGVLYHDIDGLRDVLLFDMPDFTSIAAEKEGDVTLALLPWFDRLLAVVDHERWFDRQSISRLRAESVRFGQRRLVLFNRTREEAMAEADHQALRKQADRLAAEGMIVLAFRRGRGFRLFPPGTLEDARCFLNNGPLDRTGALLAQASTAANRALNQNQERQARLKELQGLLEAAVGRAVPAPWDCMKALMTPPEHKQLEFVSRVLGMDAARNWLTIQTRRVQDVLRRVPILGAAAARGRMDQAEEDPPADRESIARNYYEATLTRHIRHVQRVARSSAFWDEVGKWTGIEPSEMKFAWSPVEIDRVNNAAASFDDALSRWNAKVESQCQGISPHVHGAFGAGAIALAIILIAAPGPVAALTLVTAKGAVGAALSQLAAATGAGAVLGKQMGRLATMIQERLLPSAEFGAVQAATASFCSLLESSCRRKVEDVLSEASALVMADNEPLARALERLSDLPRREDK